MELRANTVPRIFKLMWRGLVAQLASESLYTEGRPLVVVSPKDKVTQAYRRLASSSKPFEFVER